MGRSKNQTILILLADGFAVTTLLFAEQCKLLGFDVRMLAIRASPPATEAGLRIVPDYIISDWHFGKKISAVFIPAGPNCARQLLADPRVGELLNKACRRGSWLLLAQGVAPLLPEYNLASTNIMSRMQILSTPGVTALTDTLQTLLA